MLIYVDIDETICFYKSERHYPDALPITKNIDKINSLYDMGNTIVYWTARGSTTNIDWEEITAAQLKLWGVKHHELRLGKPPYDLFICDKAINTANYFEKMDV